VIILAIVVGVVLWQRSNKTEEISTVRPEVRTLTQVLEFSGVTDASERVAQRFSGGGKLTYVGAKEGDFVKKWQTLASIDARTAQKTLQRELNEYETQRLTYENQRDDRKDRAIDTEEGRLAQQDQIALEQTVLGVEIQSLAIEQSRVYAPIEGILIEAPSAAVGTNLALTDVYEIFNPKTLYFQAYVDEIDVAKVYVGQPAKMRLDAYSGQDFTGTVQKVAYKSIGSTNGGTVFPVEIHFDTGIDRNMFRLGMNGEAELILEERENVLSLPVEAILTRDGKNYVSVKNGDGEPEEREVQTGLETDDYIEIISGVSESDEVVLP
jgi:RND family efflux transporter MFP subunit